MTFTFLNKTFSGSIWNGERLGSLVAIDTETTVVPFHLTPELVLMQAYGSGDVAYLIPKDKIRLFFNVHYESKFIMHNASFDMDVLMPYVGRSAIYDLYDRNLVMDTSVIYRLTHLAAAGCVPFKYNLAMLSKKYLNVELEKDAEIRENFDKYLNVQIEDIDSAFKEYALKDAIITYHVYLALIPIINKYDSFRTMLSHDIQVKGELALTHIRKNGIGFDLPSKYEWLAEKNTQLDTLAERLGTWGWVRGVKGIKQRYEHIMEYIGLKDKLPRTEDGSLSSKREDLEEYRDSPFVSDYLAYIELEKATTFVRDIDSSRVHPRYTSILNTGRTSCSKPNFQQLPRLGGIREMFKADEGNTFLITDYSTLELCTLAQVLKKEYGESVMADLINEGRDLHKYYSSILNNVKEDEVTKEQRQKAKAANFGFPGGLGIDTFRKFSQGYGLELSQLEAEQMKEAWFDAFPEMVHYLNSEKGHAMTLTGRRRGDTTYCAEKNTPFQGLAADGAKLALYNLDKAGFKIVGFVHDEIITEVLKETADDLLKTQEKIMIDSMRTVVPDVTISVESQISERYCK